MVWKTIKKTFWPYWTAKKYARQFCKIRKIKYIVYSIILLYKEKCKLLFITTSNVFNQDRIISIVYLLLQGIYTNPFDSEVMKEITATTSEQLLMTKDQTQCFLIGKCVCFSILRLQAQAGG